MGNHQLPPQIHFREQQKMLIQSTSSVVSGKNRGMLPSWELTVHASVLKPGSVTFVGERDTPNINNVGNSIALRIGV
jgi:hypothetical protein